MTMAVSSLASRKDPEYQKARREGAEAQLLIRAVDDAGHAVSDARTRVFMGMNFRPQGHWFEGETDDEGLFRVQGMTCGDEIEIVADKDGYYKSHMKLCFSRMGEERDVRDGRWLPYGEEVVLRVRKMTNPRSLKKFGFGTGRSIPATNVWVGVDMDAGDFVKPYGKGETVDFEVIVQWDGRPPPQSLRCVASMRFSSPASGGYYAKKVSESAYPYVYEANADASYSVRHIAVAGRGKSQFRSATPSWDDDALVVRTRCVLNDKQMLVSACYGLIRVFKVDASWDGLPTIRLAGVFNPTSNDTNLEPK